MALSVNDYQTELDKVWKPLKSGTPNASVEIAKAVEQVYALLQSEIRVLNDSNRNAFFSEIEKFATSVAVEIARARGQPDLENKLGSLKDYLDNLESSLDKTAIENTRIFYQDAGKWAEHFSMVRMTVTTFFVLISWGVISAKWDEFSPSLGIAACFVWFVAGLFLWFFTRATCYKAEFQKYYKKRLKSPVVEIPKWKGFKQNAFLRPYKHLDEERWITIWLPFFVFFVFTFGFGWLVYKWAYHEAPPQKITWTAIVEPQSNEPFFKTNIASAQWLPVCIRDTNAISIEGFIPVNFSKILSNQLQIQIALSNLTHSSTTNVFVAANDFAPLQTNLMNIERAISALTNLQTTGTSISTNYFTQVSAELSNIVSSISNLTHVTPNNASQLQMHETGFLIGIRRREIKSSSGTEITEQPQPTNAPHLQAHETGFMIGAGRSEIKSR